MPKKKTPYRSKVKIGVDADGKPINKWIQGRTRAELAEARQAVIARYITGEALGDDRLFGDYAAEWYRVRKAPFVSASTRNNYRTVLNKHLFPAFGDRNLRSIRAVELQDFVNGFEGKSKSLITNIIGTLQGVYSAAKQDRIVSVNPAEDLQRPKARPTEPRRALTEDERRRIQALFATHEHGLYLAVMYYTGMRPGEVRGLQWGDIDWTTNLIHVQRDVDYADRGRAQVGALKTAASDRYIPMAAPLRELLYPKRQLPTAFLFPGAGDAPLASVTARRMWLCLMVDAGLADPIPADESTCYGPGDIRGQYRARITPHTLRHNFITMCWEAGIDIMLTMKMVGHTDYETTRNIYTHLSKRHLDNAQAQLNAMFSTPTPATFMQPKNQNTY